MFLHTFFFSFLHRFPSLASVPPCMIFLSFSSLIERERMRLPVLRVSSASYRSKNKKAASWTVQNWKTSPLTLALYFRPSFTDGHFEKFAKQYPVIKSWDDKQLFLKRLYCDLVAPRRMIFKLCNHRQRPVQRQFRSQFFVINLQNRKFAIQKRNFAGNPDNVGCTSPSWEVKFRLAAANFLHRILNRHQIGESPFGYESLHKKYYYQMPPRCYIIMQLMLESKISRVWSLKIS